MITNVFDFSLLDGAPKGALIACRSEENGEAILVIRQPDGGVDDYRLRGHEDFFPVSMVLAGKNSEEGIFLEGGDHTTIPYVRQEAPDYDGLYRDYLLVSLEDWAEKARDKALEEEKALLEAKRSGKLRLYLKELREEETDDSE